MLPFGVFVDNLPITAGIFTVAGRHGNVSAVLWEPLWGFLTINRPMRWVTTLPSSRRPSLCLINPLFS